MTHSTPDNWLKTQFQSKPTSAKRGLSRNAGAKWLLLGIALLALPAWANGNVLEQLKVTQGPNDTRVINVTLKDSVATPPVTFTTASPNRIIVDFAKTKSGMGRHIENVNAGSIQTVQVLESGDRTRLVLNLDGPAQHEVKTERNQVIIAVRGVKADTAGTAPAHFAATAAPKRTHSIRDVDFRRGKSGEGRIIVSLTDPGIGIDIKQQGKAIQVDFLNTTLPSGLARRLDVTDFATPAQTVETFQLNGHTRMVVTPTGKSSYSAYQTGDQFVLELTAQEAGFSTTGKRDQYTGEKISLDFYNVEVKDLLKVIADFTGLNIVTSEKVTGTISLRLKDIPWDQALDIILATKGMDKRVIGSNVIWVAPRTELAELDKRELEDRQKISELEELTTEAVRLNYVRADQAQAILSGQSVSAWQTGEAVTCSPASTGIGSTVYQGGGAPAAAGGAAANLPQRILSIRGSASSDLNTNTLFVRDTPSKIKEIKEVLASIDNPAKQVVIEARVVVADDTFSRNLGARLMLRGYGGIDGSRIGLGGSVGTTTTDAIGAINARNVTPESTFNVNLPARSIGGNPASTLGVAIVNAASTALIGLEIQALEADNRGKIISNPRVVTQNQKPAVILQGQQIPVITPGTANNPATTTYRDALLCLLVNPQILNNDDVILTVEVTKDAPREGAVGAQAIDTKRVKTQVRVKSGETAVLGGIFEQSLRNDTAKVPLLGDIPVLGYLFKTNEKRDIKSELLIFLTPRVLPENVAGIQ